MRNFTFLFLCGFAVLVTGGDAVRAQDIPAAASPARKQLADLTQDLNYLKKQVAQFKLDIEQFKRENAELKQHTQKVLAQDYVTMAQVNRSIEAVREELLSSNSKQKQEIVNEVSRQIEKLAKQTEGAMSSLTDALESQQKQPPPAKHVFSNNYPKAGVAYTVQPGDTLSGIAQMHKSKVRYIQDANKISDPTKLMVGKNIFIPQD